MNRIISLVLKEAIRRYDIEKEISDTKDEIVDTSVVIPKDVPKAHKGRLTTKERDAESKRRSALLKKQVVVQKKQSSVPNIRGESVGDKYYDHIAKIASDIAWKVLSDYYGSANCMKFKCSSGHELIVTARQFKKKQYW